MCGRFYIDVDLDDILDRYDIKSSNFQFQSRKEIFPSDRSPVIVNQGERKLEFLKWGFPSYDGKRLIINARSETIDIKPTFRESFKTRRCLIPASGFFEWEKRGKEKVKRKLYLKDKQLFSMAGLYKAFKDQKGHVFYAFTILTTTPNSLIKKIHHRMPVILTKKDEALWLDNKNDNFLFLKRVLKPYSNEMIIE